MGGIPGPYHRRPCFPYAAISTMVMVRSPGCNDNDPSIVSRASRKRNFEIIEIFIFYKDNCISHCNIMRSHVALHQSMSLFDGQLPYGSCIPFNHTGQRQSNGQQSGLPCQRSEVRISNLGKSVRKINSIFDKSNLKSFRS